MLKQTCSVVIFLSALTVSTVAQAQATPAAPPTDAPAGANQQPADQSPGQAAEQPATQPSTRPAPGAASSEYAGKTISQIAKEGYAGTEQTWKKHASMLEKVAPRIGLSQWVGEPIKPADMKGKVILLNIWSVFNEESTAEFSKVNELYEAYKDKGVLVIGACGGRDNQKMKEVVAEKAAKFPNARTDPTTLTAYRVDTYPTYCVIDQNGQLRGYGLKLDAAQAIVDKLVAEPPPAKVEKTKPAAPPRMGGEGGVPSAGPPPSIGGGAGGGGGRRGRY